MPPTAFDPDATLAAVIQPAQTAQRDPLVVFYVIFSQPVAALVAEDFEIVGATITDIRVAGAGYRITATASASGNVTLQLPADRVTSLSGASNTISNLAATAVTLLVQPTVELPALIGLAEMAAGFTAVVRFSEAVTFDDSKLVLTGLTLEDVTEIDTDEYELSLALVEGALQGQLRLLHGAGETGTGTLSLASRTYTVVADRVRPAAALTWLTAGTNQQATTIVAQLTFDEFVLNFDPADITVTGGTFTTASVVTAGRVWQITVTASAADTPVTLQLEEDLAVDAAGNGNTASNTLTRLVDNTAPTATWNGPSHLTSVANFTLVFSEPMQQTLVNSSFTSVNATVTAVRWIDPQTVVVTLRAGNTAGEASLTLPANTARDLAGNFVGSAATITIPIGRLHIFERQFERQFV